MDKKYFLSFILIFSLVNISVHFLPKGPYASMFDNSIKLSKKYNTEYEILLYGDSKATMFNKNYFKRKTLSLACENNTIIFSKYLHDDILKSQKKSLKVVFIFLGPNNYNKNGIFVIRDFALRRLTNLHDIPKILFYYDALDNAVEVLCSRLIPVYGRRMEIRDYGIIKNLVSLKYKNLLTQGMRPIKKEIIYSNNLTINKNKDYNYLLTYKRSVYNNFELSPLHVQYLHEIIIANIDSGIKTVLIQLPIKNKMFELQKSLVKQDFDQFINQTVEKYDILYFDLRKQNYEFSDINHLSNRGAYDLAINFLNPLVEELIVSR